MKRTSQIKIQLFLLGLFLALGSPAAFAGDARGDDPESLIKEFRNAWRHENFGRAHHFLGKVVATAPDRLYQIAASADSLLTYKASFSGPVADTLLWVYESAIAHSDHATFDWMVRKAVLLTHHRERYASQVERALYAPFRLDPMACPEFIIESLWDEWYWRFREQKITRDELALNWAEIDQVLEVRLEEFPRPPIGLSDLRIRTAFEARKAIGMTCEKLEGEYFIQVLDHKLQPKQWQALFAMLYLAGCHQFGLKDELMQQMKSHGLALVWIRWVANSRFDTENELPVRARLAGDEKNDRIQAIDLVHLARLQTRNEAFAEARENLLKAIELHPGWGRPYLELADLIAVSAPLCNFSRFDRKAVYWAAIEYCQEARDLDPRCEEAASKKLFEYNRKMPTREEVLFKGLQAGDTYPLRCWIEKAVTVR